MGSGVAGWMEVVVRPRKFEWVRRSMSCVGTGLFVRLIGGDGRLIGGVVDSEGWEDRVGWTDVVFGIL